LTPPATAAAPAVRSRRAAVPARPLGPARAPRRISGPARPAPRRRRGGASGARSIGVAQALLGILARLLEGRSLDRLIRGRAAIALVAFALIGIVTLQLGLLKLNAGIGRTLQREAVLQRENAALAVENSELAAGERVQSRATALGMTLVPAGGLRFLGSRGSGDAASAAAAFKPPAQGSSESTSGESGSAASGSSGTASSEGHGSEESSSAEHASQTGAEHGSSHEEGSGEAPSRISEAPASGSESAGSSTPSSAEASASGGATAGPSG